MICRYSGIRWLCLAVCLSLCLVAGAMFQKYVGFPAVVAFMKSPSAELKILRRDWSSVEQLQYTEVSHASDADLPRYLETGLLPLKIDEKSLSASYPVPKFGGAIAVVDRAVIIVDRLGSFYKYDLTSNSFGQLRLPPLPNNLTEYLRQRASLDSGAQVNLAGVESEGEFRVYDIIYLPDRQALAVAYDQFDSTVGKLRTAVSILSIDPVSLAATSRWQTIFTGDQYAPGSAFFGGGRMAYRGNDELYLTLGDHAIYYPKVAQDSKTTFGKIIEIDLNTEKWREVSKGHRNPQGLTFLQSGQLMATEHGPAGGDGLELIAENSNFGWPNVTLGTAYDSYDLGVGVGWNTTSSIVGRIDNYTSPIFAWMPSIAISQLIEIENFDPRWNGDLLVGSLKASSLYRLRLQGDRVLYSEPIWIGQRIRDLGQAQDGTIILWTDNAQLLLITVDETKLTQNRRNTAFLGDIGTAGCMSCHHFGSTHPGDPAPSLSNLLNRRIASDAFPYSPGLRARNQEHWTKELLTEFLSDPSKFASGTPMSAARVFGLNPERIGNIVDELARVSPEPQ